jgi:hypothetical protein
MKGPFNGGGLTDVVKDSKLTEKNRILQCLENLCKDRVDGMVLLAELMLSFSSLGLARTVLLFYGPSLVLAYNSRTLRH